MALEWDRELLAAFRAGERDALERVYLAYVDDVFKLVAVAFERDPREQRSLVQDVFVRAFAERARIGYDGVRPYRPYVLTLARNLLVDRARASSVERGRLSDVDVDSIIASDAPIPGEVTDEPEQAEKRAKVAAYVAALDAESRRFVALRFEQGLSQADVADQLGVTRRRIRTLEARVIKGLRRYLKK